MYHHGQQGLSARARGDPRSNVQIRPIPQAERRLRRELKDYTPGYHGLEGLLAAGLKQRIINDNEAQLIRIADTARSEVIQVDDLAPDLT